MPCWCERGGCCRQAPVKLVHASGQDGRIVRVNLLYEPIGCCSNSGSGLADEPPQELFINGFRRDTFDEWIGRLESVRKLRNTCCCGLLGFSCLLCVPCFFPCACSQAKNEHNKWDKAFREWQDEFNRQILQNCGLFVKTQSRCTDVYVSNAGNSRRERHIERWLAFALTPEDVITLKNEPHVVGSMDNCTCCGGANENELCMHP